MSEDRNKGSIAWMAKNPVAANLLMTLLIVGGILTTFIIKQEVFPPFEVDTIAITVPYPGTSPEEVEEGIVLAIEEAVRDLDGIKRVNSIASENYGSVYVDLLSDTDDNKALQDIKNAIDGITTFPEDSEKPIVTLIRIKTHVITLVLYGDQTPKTLRKLAEEVRDDLLQSPDITSIELAGVRPVEIQIEVPEANARAHGLTLNDVARMVRAASIDYSAGGVKAPGGEVLLRVQERRDLGKEYSDIPVVSRADGSQVLLGEIAEIRDGLAETDEAAFFNDKPAVMLRVQREGDQTPVEVAEAVKTYLAKLEKRLPEGVKVATFEDNSEEYNDRVQLLMRNAAIGLVLVLGLLGLFLNLRLAFWVTLGIPVSFLGALLFLPSQDVSINMVSLFAFIMALGIVVDDAIVVGENIYTMRRQGAGDVRAAIDGTREVHMPVVFAVLTNIVAFLPLLFLEGVMGKIFRIMPTVVCLVFLMSLVEALYILPAHMAHSKADTGTGDGEESNSGINRFQQKISLYLERAIERYYRPVLEQALEYRYLSVAVGVAILMIVLGYIGGGRTDIGFSPKAESDVVAVGVELPYGAPVEETQKIQERLVAAAKRALEKHGGEKAYEGIFSHIGVADIMSDSYGIIAGGHACNIRIFLIPSSERDFTGEQLSDEWRKEMGDVPGVERIYFQVVEIGPPAGRPIDIQLMHRDHDRLVKASAELAEALSEFSAAKDVDDGFQPGKPQLDFKIRPEAYSLGLTPFEVGSQVRAAFYGAEALRLQRGRDEVKVMVRFPEEDRKTELSVEELMIRAPGGGELPLREAAFIERGRAYTNIRRADGRRKLNVAADVVPKSAKGAIMRELAEKEVPRLQRKYPGLTFSLEGEAREVNESMMSLAKNYVIALIVIFGMLGVVFKSYIQPLIIMVSIPFGIVGAVIGHLVMGFDLTVVSMLGITALSGVVLNDSLVLIDFANRRRTEGLTAREAIASAGLRRFRPIMLTTLTTFFGLAPMIFETSFQAQILVPMAISLGYGILFSTLIILLLVPSLYLIVEDIKSFFGIKDRDYDAEDREESARKAVKEAARTKPEQEDPASP